MDWTALATQVPLVAAFIWFALENQKRFTEALDKRDELFEKRNAAVCSSLEKLAAQIAGMTQELIKHDANTKPAVDAILRNAQDEPGSRPRRRKDDLRE